MPDLHCELSPSASARFLRCPGSHRIVKTFQSVHGETDSKPARQGTLAHRLGELELSVLRGTMDRAAADEEISKIRVNPDFEEGLLTQARQYAGQVWSLYEKADDAILLLEQRVDIPIGLENGEVFDLFGTADAILCEPETLTVIDFKSGRIPVDPSDEDFIINPQLGIYAAGAYDKLKPLYPDIKKIEIVIVQPLYGTSRLTITTEDLEVFRRSILEPGIRNALSEQAPLKAGKKQCKYCPANVYCPEVLRQAGEAMTDEELAQYEDLTQIPSWKLSKVLERLTEFDFLAADISKELKCRLEGGRAVNGYRLKPGAKKRKWKKASTKTVLKKVEQAGIPTDKVLTLKGIPEVTKILKKAGADELLDDFIEFSQNAPSLERIEKRTKPERIISTGAKKPVPPKTAPTRSQDSQTEGGIKNG